MNMKYNISFFGVFFLLLSCLQAQEKDEQRLTKVKIDGEIVTALITNNDTLLLADLENVSFTSPRKFKNRAERRLYYKYRRSADKAYPYAVEAIRIFREMEEVTATMSPRKRKKHTKRLQKQLKKDFSSKLKKLTKTQGKVLIKMIEKELDTPFYDLVKNLRGGFTAFYWHQFGKMYGYDLKQGYKPDDDPLLDAVLSDYEITY